MFNIDAINYIEFKLLEGQVDLILDALELYAFNLHKVWPVDKDSNLEDLRNCLLYHTYETILSKYSRNKIGYDVSKECRLIVDRKKRKIFYLKRSKNKLTKA